MTNRLTVGSGPRVHLGISTCPNDTFAFAALLEGRVPTGGLTWDIELLDIDQLNARLVAGEFDVAKVSFHAALTMADRFWVLPVGSALGFGVGPLLLSAKPDTVPIDPTQLTLTPGRSTTAQLLFDLFYPQTTRVEQVVFSQIMPRLSEKTADFGVCIHEGRFTYQSAGLYRVADLGEMWESQTGSPLPLGGLVMHRDRDESLVATVVATIDASLENARKNPESALPAMRRYAAEFDDAVLKQHVELYVNDWTVDLGQPGTTALQTLAQRWGQLTDQPNRQFQIFQRP